MTIPAELSAVMPKIRELLAYDELTGYFTNKINRGPRARQGVRSGSLGKNGYRDIRVCGYRIYEHRLAWLYVHNEYPDDDIDHKDGNRSNNAISNLRHVSRSVNLQNQRIARPASKTGILGVSHHNGRFKAQIKVKGENLHLGVFDDSELAHLVYVTAKERLHVGSML